ncbi:hypothetical protein FGO68_gene12030 [Halteria grandinella]|uniref:CobW C-terminal domain-containing protein n=1 Tax=Halteria grandinella TaxID=5974 RepID=A0A8J8SW20_HALGN|nr:hypothetical protein FGO68_gene12030 [Halteria grandinella]
MESKCKVIIVCGFLGSGKTTLIEGILKAPSLGDRKIGVIQNEYSDQMGMEGALMKDASGNDIEDFYEMPNGCICCSGKGDLINTLDTLLSKKHLDYVLVEMNGLADPSQIVQTFWVDDGLGSMVILHQTIALVDVGSFGRKLASTKVIEAVESTKGLGSGVYFEEQASGKEYSERDLLLRQLVYADKILLNKIDLIPSSTFEQTLSEVRDLITQVNPTAELRESTYSQADLDFLIDKSDTAIKPSPPPHTHSHDCSHSCTHIHLPDIQSIFLDFGASLFDLQQLERCLGELLWEQPNSMGATIMRCKGTLNANDGQSYMLQGVEEVFEVKRVDGVSTNSKLLFIGRGIDREALFKVLQSCVLV